MMPLSIALLILLFCAWFKYERDQAQKNREQASGQFWEKEQSSNRTRKQDISALPYLTVTLEALPFGPETEEELILCQNTVKALACKKILRLTGVTNTELKLLYGPANLTALQDADENFTLLCRTLQQWAVYLMEAGRTKDAETVLAYAVSIHTDIGAGYKLLAGIYKESGKYARIPDLLQKAQGLPDMVKPGVIKALKEMCRENPYH